MPGILAQGIKPCKEFNPENPGFLSYSHRCFFILNLASTVSNLSANNSG
jgi:hypothetical protein